MFGLGKSGKDRSGVLTRENETGVDHDLKGSERGVWICIEFFRMR